MKNYLFLIPLMGLFMLFFSCKNADRPLESPSVKEEIAIEKLTSTNENTRDYYDYFHFLNTDSTTEDGWRIQYLLKADSAQYYHIRLSKGTQSQTDQYMKVGSNFIPIYIGENEKYLFFEGACANDCRSINKIRKKDLKQVKDYLYVLDYDMELKKLIYLNTDDDAGKGTFKIGLLNMENDQEKSITFKSNCTAARPIQCIDRIQLLKNHAVIFPASHEENAAPRKVIMDY